jgi:hypothetical protein
MWNHKPIDFYLANYSTVLAISWSGKISLLESEISKSWNGFKTIKSRFHYSYVKKKNGMETKTRLLKTEIKIKK